MREINYFLFSKSSEIRCMLSAQNAYSGGGAGMWEMRDFSF